jgi:hypothetical protein
VCLNCVNFLLKDWGVKILKSFKNVAAVAAMLSLLAQPVLANDMAALLSSPQGKVLVNTSTSYEPALSEMSLQIGDRIFVGSKSSASLVYEACTISLLENSVYTVPAQPACAGAKALAVVEGVFITPVAATAPNAQLKMWIANYSSLQKDAAASGRTETADCLTENINKMRALPNFWSRNPGVDPLLTINDLDVSARSCGEGPRVETAKILRQKPPSNPVVISKPSPIIQSTSSGGMSGTTLAVLGVAGAAGLGLGAVLLLSKKSSNTPVSSQPN